MIKMLKPAAKEVCKPIKELDGRLMKTICSVLLLCSLGIAQEAPKYWTPRRIWETSGVTALHLADSAQTCYHESQGNWHEHNAMTPPNCAGASVALIGSGPLLQYASYKLTRKYPNSRTWKIVDRALPHLEMSISINSIRCSNVSGGCNRYGF